MDDPDYITENYRVRSGLTPEGIRWAFTTTHAGNWHPLTWLAHMLDVDLFGMNPGGHHRVSLLLHMANTLILFSVFRKITADLWPSAVIAALFALHPLHVESVAWAAERKDVLSTFFGFLALWRYTLYTSDPGLKTYLPVLVYFSLSLLSKPMLVTLPCVFLLLDYWPLGRLQINGCRINPTPAAAVSPGRLIVEKVPLFALSAGSSVVTFLAQQSGQAVMQLETLSIPARLTHCLVAYTSYIKKMLIPAGLGVHYPHPGLSGGWEIAGAGVFIFIISAAVLRCRRSHPYVLVGWLWYLGTLVPVIGIVQVGGQAIADRYTYVPAIGLFVMTAWGGSKALKRWSIPAVRPGAVAIGFIVGFMIISWVQVRLWTDSITLYTHTLGVTDRNFTVHNNLGIALTHEGRVAEAVYHFTEALRIKPDYERAVTNLAKALASKGHTEKAVALYERALDIDPQSAEAHNNLAVALQRRGQAAQAMTHFQQALRIDPDYRNAHYNIGKTLAGAGRGREAIVHFKEALRIDPLFDRAHNNLGVELDRQGKPVAAMRHYRIALRTHPDFAEAHNNLGISLIRFGRITEAEEHFRAALRLNPDFMEARSNLGKVEAMMKEKTGDR